MTVSTGSDGDTRHQAGSFWVVLVIAASAFTFVLGILVGRGTVPALHRDMDAIKQKFAGYAFFERENNPIRYKIDMAVADDAGEKMEFYDALKTPASRHEFTPRPDVSETVVKPSVKPEPVVDSAAISSIPAPDKKPVVKTAAQTPAAVKTPTEKTVPAVDASEKKFTIQVASVKDEAVADKLVAELKAAGFPAYRVLGKVEGKGLWFRVRIGHFSTKAEADGYLDGYTRKTRQKGIVIGL